MQGICAGTMSCETSCGYIVSPLYPHIYPANTACSWLMQVNDDAYIQLTFLALDIFEELSDTCTGDYVIVQDIEQTGEMGDVIGSYCNTNKPPYVVFSSWNGLLLQFFTDSVDGRSGFMAKYISIQITSIEGISWQDNHPGKDIMYLTL